MFCVSIPRDEEKAIEVAAWLPNKFAEQFVSEKLTLPGHSHNGCHWMSYPRHIGNLDSLNPSFPRS